jgi:hypothetical protein
MKRKALAAFLLSLVVLAIPADAQRRRKRSRRTTPKTFSSESYSTRTITERITPDAFVVAPGKLMYFPVSLPQSAAWGMITGRFRAQGGNGNDIEMYVFNPDGFENYINGHSVSTLYNSGRVTVGSIDLYIPKGTTYYLVFTNKFSVFANKAITSDIVLKYDQLERR